MRTLPSMSVLSRSLFSLYCRTSRGNQRRFPPGLFNSQRNVINSCPSMRMQSNNIMRTLPSMSVLSRSLFSPYCRTSRGNQRRFLPGLFNSQRNVIKYCPSWGNSRYCSPSWVPGPSVNTDPRGGPALPDQPSFSVCRRSVVPRGGIIANPPGVFSVRHPGCRNGNASFKLGQRVAV